MQQLLQPRKPVQAAQTVEAVERWEPDIREYETKFNKELDDDVQIGVVLGMALLPCRAIAIRTRLT
jgi:hypothetical protein